MAQNRREIEEIDKNENQKRQWKENFVISLEVFSPRLFPLSIASGNTQTVTGFCSTISVK